jgi:hypothetical protein
MRGENQRAMESALAAYERAYAATPPFGTAAGPAAVGGGGAALELHEALDAAHEAALQVALVEFRQQV